VRENARPFHALAKSGMLTGRPGPLDSSTEAGECKSEIRNPKPEGNPKPEARDAVASERADGLRISGLGLLSDFGYRISDGNLIHDLHRTFEQPCRKARGE
jgi:hypothetical protein